MVTATKTNHRMPKETTASGKPGKKAKDAASRCWRRIRI